MAGATQFSPVNVLNNQRNDWKVRVKVFISWKKCYYNNPSSVASLEMVFIDNLGNKIRGSVLKETIPYFENIFKEDNFVDMSYFGVSPCDDRVKIVQHAYKLNIYRTTKVQRCHPFHILNDGFQIVPFENIIEWKINKSQVIDVVGRLMEMNPLRVNRDKGVDRKSIDFVLEDSRY